MKARATRCKIDVRHCTKVILHLKYMETKGSYFQSTPIPTKCVAKLGDTNLHRSGLYLSVCLSPDTGCVYECNHAWFNVLALVLMQQTNCLLN